MKQTFVLFWSLAGLVTLDVVLRAPAHPTPPPAPTAADTAPVVTAIRTTCELPAGTVIFVVRDKDGVE